ncbi:predicted protein [Phaeodactylum tricornutum CCAP 1055/1]|jgi:hypothetical protein|uniref:Uncharacterized protein n=2 Tax=Phaeodactylum tricornutum TaxID=2850 RepID=B7G3U6_PHATC|nr:predicted protein [Phaeodactylum tricornutum CCAP 1055/1]EEC46713.1 predicted protein [Phaeodactylum tricornutum CCAP 1055/1]|eukprot:XP_002181499.1 predicted protein [Phaeodactylum tricornutum CCAP 1055/1]
MSSIVFARFSRNRLPKSRPCRRCLSSSTDDNFSGSSQRKDGRRPTSKSSSRGEKLETVPTEPVLSSLSEFMKEHAKQSSRRDVVDYDLTSLIASLSKRNKKEFSEEKNSLSAYGDDSKRIKRRDVSASSGKPNEKLLFEVFKIPDAPAARSETAFEEGSFRQYSEILESIIADDPKFMRRHTAKPIADEVAEPLIVYLRSEEPEVEVGLPTFKHALKEGISVRDTNDMKTQKLVFMEKLGVSDAQHRLIEGTLIQISNRCAKEARGLPLEVIWAKVKEAGFISQRLLQNLLYISSTFATGSRQKHITYGRLTGTSTILDVLSASESSHSSDGVDEEDNVEEMLDLADEIAVYHDLLYEPTEQSILTRVRLLVAQGHAKAAENLLVEHDCGFRLRAYSPVLRLHMEQGNAKAVMHLYRRMKRLPLVHFEAETYVHLIAGLAELGYFQLQSDPIDGIEKLGFVNGAGPGLFDELLTEMAEDILELTSQHAKRLNNALAKGFPESSLEVTSSLGSVLQTSVAAGEDDFIASRVHIDQSSGHCPVSGVKLRLMSLEPEQAKAFKQNILDMATSEQDRYELKSKQKRAQRSDFILNEFMKWLDTRAGDPFTAILDGPNIGYYMQNFEGGRFSYHQLKFVVDSLESMNEKPLVILPRKYANDRIHLTIGGVMQTLKKEELQIRNYLIKTGRVYLVPPGHLDDYFWMLSSLSTQTTARNGRDLSVLPGDPGGRWPGARPMLISNDQMRDHKLDLLEPKLFRRWYSNFMVHYNFAAFVGGQCSHPDIGFNPADFFSREIQMNQRVGGASCWHFPLTDFENEWFCISIPKVIPEKAK